MKKILSLGVLMIAAIILVTACGLPKETGVMIYSPFDGVVSSSPEKAGMSDDVIKSAKEWKHSFVVVTTPVLTQKEQWLVFRNISRVYFPYWNPERWDIQNGHPLIVRANSKQDGRDVWFVSAENRDIQKGDRVEALYYDAERKEYVKVFEAIYWGKTTFINLTQYGN